MSNSDNNIDRILFYVIILCSIVLFAFIGTNVHAAAAIYSDNHSCSSTYYNIEKMDGTSTYGQTSTSYNISWAYISFSGTENLSANTYYDLVITFRSNISNNIFNDDGGDNLGIRGMHLFQTSSLCGSHNGEASITSYSISGSKLTVRVLIGPVMLDYWEWYQRFTFVGSNGINTVTFTEVDTTGSSGIIQNANDNTNTIVNNNNQNTQDIIDSQNQNTQDLKDTIDDSFNNCRSSVNLWNLNTMVTNSTGITLSPTGFIYYRGTETGGKYVYNLIHVDSGKPYTMSFTGGASSTPIIIYYDSVYGNILAQSSTGSLTFTSSTSRDIYATIIINSSVTSFSASDIMFYQGSDVIPFELYGEDICSNRLDDISGSINDLNDTLTNPDVSSGLIDDILDSEFYHNDDLTSIIVAPLTLLNSLISSSSTCEPLQLPFQIKIGSFYDKSSTGASLPCGSILWSHASSVLTSIYRLVVCGFIYYHVAIYCWHVLDNSIDPFKDKLEVIDL